MPVFTEALVYEDTKHKNSCCRSIRQPTSVTKETKTFYQTMVVQLNYQTISTVLDSWEDLRRIPDYEKEAGVILFQQ